MRRKVSIVAVCLVAAGALTAVYTAWLFAQAKARDLWQSPLLPPHLAAQAALRRAFDPELLSNPDKVLPSPATCGDVQSVPEGVWV